MDIVDIILSIVFAVALILAIYIPVSITKRYDKLATKYIKDGLQSGIKDVSYPSHHTINTDKMETKQQPQECELYCRGPYNCWVNWPIRCYLETKTMTHCPDFTPKTDKDGK